MIEQRTHRKEAFLLSVDEMLGRPAREEPEELIGGSIPPVPHLIGKPGFPFSRFFGHIELLVHLIVAGFQVYSMRPALRARRARNGYRWGLGRRNTRVISQKLINRPTASSKTLLIRR